MHGYQKVYNVVEESTTNNWQEHMAHITAHPVALPAFRSCVAVTDVVGCVCQRTAPRLTNSTIWVASIFSFRKRLLD